MRTLLCLGVLLLSGALAGCSTPADDATDTGVIVVDSPFNRTADMNLRPHLHDYWQGRHTLTVADTDIAAPGYTWFSTEPISVATLRPEPGKVVPQGAGWVNVTVSWQDDPQAVPPNQYTNPQLYVKTAADNTIRLRANLTSNPQTVPLRINLTQADLPHQVLSAWQFDLFVTPTPLAPGGQPFEYAAFVTANIHFTVTTDRTEPIPLFPGHPDKWQNRTEFQLTKGGKDLFYNGDPTTTSWACFGGCPETHHPDDKVVVPLDATRVVVKLGLSGTSPTKLGLEYHDASSRDYVKLTPTEDTPTLRTYTIDVNLGGDGPYATQSQWEFVPYPESPQENGWIRETYTFEATVYRHV